MGDLEAKTQILLAPILPGVRPLIEYVQPGEFLISSPVGDNSLGVFLNGAAEPTRNAIEWPGHPLSFCARRHFVCVRLLGLMCFVFSFQV